MQHSQIRKKFELVKIFAKQDPNTVQKTLEILKFDGTNTTDITPSFTVQDLNSGYYSTEFSTPNEDCYLIIKFCGSPMVIRVGDPTLQFLFYNTPSKIIPFTHYNDEGVQQAQDNLTELGGGFYYYTPVVTTLGYIEVYGRPSIIEIPYCSDKVGVAIDVEWTKKVIKRQFGTKSIKQLFRTKLIKQNINIVTIIKEFSKKVITKDFRTKVIKKKFKAKVCS